MSDDEDASTQSSGTSGGSYGDWVEPDSDPACVSLLGPHALASPALAWAELAAATGFDALPEARRRGWGTYQLVRLVNHLRRLGAAAQGGSAAVAAALRAALTPEALRAEAPLWRDDSLLQPALQDDALLMDVVSQEDLGEGSGGDGAAAGAAAAEGGGAAPAGAAAPGAEAAAALLPGGALSAAEAAALRAELARSKELLGLVVSGAYDGGSAGGGGGGALDPHRGSGKSDNLTYYFDSYASNTGIHRTMLADRPRTEAYRAAIQGARGGALAGARVLDLGCGTGILSLFAADAGARAVVALDASSVAQDAAEIVRLNGKGAVVACVMGRCEEAALHLVQSSGEAQAAGAGAAAATAAAPLVGQGCTVLCGSLVGSGSAAPGAAPAAAAAALPPPPPPPTRVFDAIVSEWMGYALLYESMLASVLIARDRYLKPGGVLLPSSATLTLGAVSDGELWAERVQWWRSVYGYDMAPMARHAWPEPLVEDLPAGSLASAPPHARLARLCMATMAQEDQDLRGVAFELRIEGGTPRAAAGEGGGVLVHALAVWFSVDFGEAERYWPAAAAGGAPPAAAAPAPPSPPAAGEEDVPELEVVAASGSGSAQGAQAVVPETPRVTLCTSPTSPPTHWHHTVLLLREPPCVQPGGTLRGTFSMVRDAKNPREYRFAVELEGGAVQRWHLG